MAGSSSSLSHEITAPVDAARDAKKLTIAWLIDGCEVYGVKRAIVSLATGIQRAGANPIILYAKTGETFQACQTARLPMKQVDLGRSPSLHYSRGLWRRLRTLREMASYQNRVRHHVAATLREINAQSLHVLGVPLLKGAGQAAYQAGIPCFWEMTAGLADRYPFHFNRRLYRWVLKHHHIRPLANSRYTGGTLGHGRNAPTVLYLGVDPNLFSPARTDSVTRAELGIPSDAIVFLVAARLDVFKGQDRVLEAMLSLPPGGPRTDLVLLGGPLDDDFTRRLRQRAADAGATDRLHLIGPVADPERYYAMADVAINSRVDAEPYGLSVVEAMMSSKPVLVHALGGPAETVTDGVTGWHIASPDVAAMRRGLERVLADRERWPEMGRAARRIACEQLSLELQAKNYLELVRQAIHHAPE